MTYVDTNGHIAQWWSMLESQQSWHSVDSHFEDGARSISLWLLPTKPANNRFMTMCNTSTTRIHIIQDQQSLRHCRRLFSWSGSEGIAISFADKCRQSFGYDLLQPISALISQDAWPKLIDALLTLIFKIGQGGYSNQFCLSRRPQIA